MIPDPFIAISDHVQYKVRLTYRQWDYLTGKDEERKQQVFTWLHDLLSQFRAKNEPNFDASKMGDFMLLRADESGYQDTQMSQESLHIEQRDGCVIKITDKAFSAKSVKNEPMSQNQDDDDDDDDDVLITNDDNTDVSLPFYENNFDHSYSAPKPKEMKKPTEAEDKNSQKTGAAKKSGKQFPVRGRKLPHDTKPTKQLSILSMLERYEEEEETCLDEDYNEELENFMESEELDDIPHTLDPIIERFSQTHGNLSKKAQPKKAPTGVDRGKELLAVLSNCNDK